MAEDILTMARELAEVTRLVEADDFGTTLDRFVTRIVRTIPGCAGATITVRSKGAVETVADHAAPLLDPLDPGPIVEALTFVEPRRLEDAHNDQRWPAFSARLLNSGFGGCLALPLSTGGDDNAVLALFSDEPNQFGDLGFDVVMLLTLHAGVVFDNASLYNDSSQLVTQLRTALRTRALVGRAQGMLMRHFGYGSDHAFDALRATSQNSNIKLRDLAEQLVEAHETGNFEAVLERLSLTG